jgi:hypothetical protein
MHITLLGVDTKCKAWTRGISVAPPLALFRYGNSNRTVCNEKLTVVQVWGRRGHCFCLLHRKINRHETPCDALFAVLRRNNHVAGTQHAEETPLH